MFLDFALYMLLCTRLIFRIFIRFVRRVIYICINNKDVLQYYYECVFIIYQNFLKSQQISDLFYTVPFGYKNILPTH